MLTCQEERGKRCFRYENVKMKVKEKSFNDYQLTMVMKSSESMLLASTVPPESFGCGTGDSRRNQLRRVKGLTPDENYVRAFSSTWTLQDLKRNLTPLLIVMASVQQIFVDGTRNLQDSEKTLEQLEVFPTSVLVVTEDEDVSANNDNFSESNTEHVPLVLSYG